MYASIHEWTWHLNGTITSRVANVFFTSMPWIGVPTSNGWLILPSARTLCSSGSLFRITSC